MNLSVNKQKWMLFASSALIPVIPMLYLYHRNADYVLLSHIMIVSFLMALVSAAIYGVLSLMYKNAAPAVIGTVIAWIIFFGYSKVYQSVMNTAGIRHRHLIPLTLALVAVILFLLKRFTFGYRLSDGSAAAVLMVSVFTCILFLWNAGEAVIANRSYHKHSSDQSHLIKADFNVDGSITDLPDIYWIHCDGMLGFDPMERYSGDPQTEFSRFLADNGFMVNRHANFDANHRTVQAVPTLMCPGYYDAVTDGVEKGIPKAELMTRKTMHLARMNNESVGAFDAKGYKTVVISDINNIFPITTDFIYDTGSLNPKMLITGSDLRNDASEDVAEKIANMTNVENIYILLKQSTIIGAGDPVFRNLLFSFKDSVINGERGEIPAYTEEVAAIQEKDAVDPTYHEAIRGLLDSRNIEGPKFVLMNFFMPHCPFIYDENGNPNRHKVYATASYPPHHRYTARVLGNIVNAILEQNPDAVIVLQADHGVHNIPRDTIVKAFDGSEIDVADIWNGVMSAVRIPEKYVPPSETLEPLDISRYLVNNYVGQNYEYLDYGK